MAVIDQVINEKYAIYNGDCIEVMKDIPDEKIHLSVYSPPFGGLYNYSSSERDLSNCVDYNSFFDHYRYVVQHIERITISGRISAVHCTDVSSSNSGKDYLTDFPGDIIRLHQDCGFDYIGRHTIWKEPLWVRNRTMQHNLSHITIVKDGVYGGVASADYMLIFRKKGESIEPVKHPTGLNYYAGQCPIPKEIEKHRNHVGDQKLNRYSHWIWRRYASSVWDDINMGHVLPFQDCKEEDDEKHVHPLQLDVIDRVVTLRSNKGETVFTPFMGVGSEVYSPVCLGRKGIGVELKESYYRQAVQNMKIAAGSINPTKDNMLFDIE
jgi:DNA modification methylase